MKTRTKLLFLVIDVVAMIAAMLISIWLRFEAFSGHTHMALGSQLLAFSIPATVIILWWMGLYDRTLAFTSIPDLIAVFQAATLSSLAKVGFLYAQFQGFSRSVLIADWLLNMLLIGLSRVTPRLLLMMAEERWVRWLLPRHWTGGKKVLIYGAGRAGEGVARELLHAGPQAAEVVGFLDDDPTKAGQFIHGLKVLGNRAGLPSIIAQHRVEEVIIAISSATGPTLREIARACRAAGLRVKIVPGLDDLLAGRQARLQVRDIDVSDLLRRPPVELDPEGIAAYVRGRRVLVTGAGGSIGSEICRQLLPFGPGALTLLGAGENSIYQIHQELLQRPDAAGCGLATAIANIQDLDRVRQVFAERRPEIVFHAAAHKHVPLMEDHPGEAVKNNVLGTRNLLQAAGELPPERFVMISTDKAVKPTSVMGATKRVAEMLVRIAARQGPTRYSAVRFGNVLGSRGSVIPLFMKQIERGEAITITHPDMVRYFMTIPEASQLVIQAGALGQGGEIFLLDMGEPVRVLDLAEDLIRLAGLEPGKDVRIEFSGTRPGEKLVEELLTQAEETTATRNAKIFTAASEPVDEGTVLAGVEALVAAARRGDREGVLAGLQRLVPAFPRS
ncbi:MAG: polysaccharide biosynthesis protein [Candidatus Riflebacteria bacterium]|nr:polysaccharide biosynthesis protein [Candidatus Riflebacteria bacterium]